MIGDAKIVCERTIPKKQRICKTERVSLLKRCEETPPSSWFDGSVKNKEKQGITEKQFLNSCYYRMKQKEELTAKKVLDYKKKECDPPLFLCSLQNTKTTKKNRNKGNNSIIEKTEKKVMMEWDLSEKKGRSSLKCGLAGLRAELKECSFTPKINKRIKYKLSKNEEKKQFSIPRTKELSQSLRFDLPTSNWVSLSQNYEDRDEDLDPAEPEMAKKIKAKLREGACESKLMKTAQFLRKLRHEDLKLSKKEKKHSKNMPTPDSYQYLFRTAETEQHKEMDHFDWMMYKEECIEALKKKKKLARRRTIILKKFKKPGNYLENTLLKIEEAKNYAKSFKDDYRMPAENGWGVQDYFEHLTIKDIWKELNLGGRDKNDSFNQISPREEESVKEGYRLLEKKITLRNSKNM